MQLDTIEQEFNEQGYVVLRGLLPDVVLRAVGNDLERWVDEQATALLADGLLEQSYAEQTFARRLACLYAGHMERAPNSLRRELHWEGMFELFFCPAVVDVVERLLGMSEIRLYPNYTVRPKFPQDAATEVLWHQDAGYTASGLHGRDDAAAGQSVDALRMVNVWAPLVPARRANGCMQFVPKSHRLGLARHERRRHYLEISAAEITAQQAHAIDVECDPGDVVLFSNMLYHRGLPNGTDTIRWSCDWRYQDARQSTMRSEVGHMARSLQAPETVVSSPAQWASLSFR
ncbi:MAG: phytanoyl-CoA dioxygenase family protein [bacterium]|nr:phytanoyl-CoA dioxygenase family protein [bacterium]